MTIQHGAQGPSVLCAANDRQRGHRDRDPRLSPKGTDLQLLGETSSGDQSRPPTPTTFPRTRSAGHQIRIPFTNNFFPEVTAERGCLSRVRVASILVSSHFNRTPA